MNSELVSILLPVHKDNPFLREALGSLIDQSYQNIEILFLDNSVSGLDPDIWNLSKLVKYIKVPGEYGLSQTLNVGIKESLGMFIARMDYDDVSHVDRISEQVNFLISNENIGICGTYAEVIGQNFDENVKPGQIITRPTQPDSVIEFLLHKNPLLHPTVMMRREMILKHKLNYRKRFDSAEDLDFWARAVRHFDIANIPVPLLKYRIHEAQYSREDGVNSQFQCTAIRIRHALWVISKIKGQRTKAGKAFLKNTLKFIRFSIKVKKANNFKKFG
jgi:glycosyltransferase involved in cell wall biosynthesis